MPAGLRLLLGPAEMVFLLPTTAHVADDAHHTRTGDRRGYFHYSPSSGTVTRRDMNVLAIFSVFTGAGLGALLRWFLGNRLNPVFPTLPLGTLAANLLGGLLVGLAVAWFGRHPGIPPEARLLVITGFMGGLTTFSTFSAEVVTLLARNEYLWGFSAAFIHLAGSLSLTAAGMALAHLILPRA